jgi:hypothetical protein
VVAGIAAGVIGGGAAPAGAQTPSFMEGANCDEHQAFVEGDGEAVAARLPRGYTPLRSASGAPLVFARALRCGDSRIDGRGGPSLLASYGVVIESPDGRGCVSSAPAFGTLKGDALPICNWYTMAWLSGERRVLDWLRAGTPGVPAAHATGLTFELGEQDPAHGGAPFRFRAPGSFAIDAVSQGGGREASVRGGYWMETSRGTVKLPVSTDDLVSGGASGTVTAAAGSELARLMGATERPYAPGYSGFSSLHIGNGVYRKQVLTPGEDADRFAGSCDVHGPVVFDPPAKTEEQQLTYTYDGRGTCSGTLNGREVSELPVRMAHGGRSRGGCSSARTFTPSRGMLTLSGGQRFPYTLDFTTTETQVSGTLYGDRWGTAPGRGTFLTDGTPPDVVLQCGGDGAKEIGLDITFETQSPLVAPRTGRGRRSADAPAAGDRARRPRSRRRVLPGLRVSVSPRRVRPGRRTRFIVRVATQSGRPVVGAVVRFAGRRVRVGARGTARIVARLRRGGRRVVRVSKPGYRGARATVVVRRARRR